MVNAARCTICGMEGGDHDRACWQQQLHEQKMTIIKRLADLKKNMAGDDFVDRLRKSTLDVAMEIVRQA